MTCGTCAYWDQQACHRRPPWVASGQSPQWPTTKAEDWCGEHALAVPPSPTTRERHLAKELEAAGTRLGLIAEGLQQSLGPARLYEMAHSGNQRAMAAAGQVSRG